MIIGNLLSGTKPNLCRLEYFGSCCKGEGLNAAVVDAKVGVSLHPDNSFAIYGKFCYMCLIVGN